MNGYSSSKHQKAIRALKKSGLKVTRSREAVISTFCQSNKPLNHKDIYHHILEQGLTPTDLTSIYRTVEVLKQNNLIHEVQGEGFLFCQHSDCTNHKHIITFCTSCKESSEIHIPDQILGPMQEYLKEQAHFTPRVDHFQIEGLCRICLSH